MSLLERKKNLETGSISGWQGGSPKAKLIESLQYSLFSMANPF
jgi:hypothetical protein